MSSSRQYIRHISDISIEFELQDQEGKQKELHDISVGGLSFESTEHIATGSIISIRFPHFKAGFQVKSVVVWCKKEDDIYDIGVKFLDNQSAYRVRLVEQICYIENYKKKVWESEGRKLSGKKAAMEWIEKYAKDFPDIVGKG